MSEFELQLVRNLEEKIEQLEKEIVSLKGDVDEAEGVVVRRDQEIQRLTSELELRVEDVIQLERDVADLKAKIAHMEEGQRVTQHWLDTFTGVAATEQIRAWQATTKVELIWELVKSADEHYDDNQHLQKIISRIGELITAKTEQHPRDQIRDKAIQFVIARSKPEPTAGPAGSLSDAIADYAFDVSVNFYELTREVYRVLGTSDPTPGRDNGTDHHERPTEPAGPNPGANQETE